jgi:hypothetical protein
MPTYHVIQTTYVGAMLLNLKNGAAFSLEVVLRQPVTLGHSLPIQYQPASNANNFLSPHVTSTKSAVS